MLAPKSPVRTSDKEKQAGEAPERLSEEPSWDEGLGESALRFVTLPGLQTPLGAWSARAGVETVGPQALGGALRAPGGLARGLGQRAEGPLGCVLPHCPRPALCSLVTAQTAPVLRIQSSLKLWAYTPPSGRGKNPRL